MDDEIVNEKLEEKQVKQNPTCNVQIIVYRDENSLEKYNANIIIVYEIYLNVRKVSRLNADKKLKSIYFMKGSEKCLAPREMNL